MSNKKVFGFFVDAVFNEMKRGNGEGFEWGKLCLSGATRVAKELQVKIPEVHIETKGNEVSVSADKYKHRFITESSCFHYVRENGKKHQDFKAFTSLEMAFLKQETKSKKDREEREKVKARKMEEKQIEDASKEETKIEKGKGSIKVKKMMKKYARMARTRKAESLLKGKPWFALFEKKLTVMILKALRSKELKMARERKEKAKSAGKVAESAGEETESAGEEEVKTETGKEEEEPKTETGKEEEDKD